jgi:hypothetical protein
MNNTQAKQVKWDLVDHLLSNFTETDTFYSYSPDEQAYALDRVKRIAALLGVKNHIYL